MQSDGVVYKWFSSVALPFALACSTYFITASIESSKLDSEYVKISLSILGQSNLEGDPESQEALKNWAVRVLDDKSPVEMTDQEKRALSSSVFANLYKELDSLEMKEIKKMIQALSAELENDKKDFK